MVAARRVVHRDGIRFSRGNFRLVHRLFAQVARVMKINNLTVITSDVIETARGTLVIGENAT